MALQFHEDLFDHICWRVIRQTQDRFDLLVKGDYLTVIVPNYYSDYDIVAFMEKNAAKIAQAVSIANQEEYQSNYVRVHPEEYKDLLEEGKKIKQTAERRLQKQLEKKAQEMGITYQTLEVKMLDEKLSDSDMDEKIIYLDYLLHVLPVGELEGAIIHELCHMKYPNEGHSDSFRDEEQKWNPRSEQLYDIERRHAIRMQHLIFGNCDVYDERF